MLQQTRAATVVSRFERFVRRYPDVRALAAATTEEVCEEWAGLGYYARARNLHAAAVRVVEEHGGTIPRDLDALRSLPGVGRYTAGAVASIAFGQAVPAVDGNVDRVISRVFAIGEATARTRLDAIERTAAELVVGAPPAELNQALMDVGATLCLPRAPRCPGCPLAPWCRARAEGRPERYLRARVRPIPKRLDVAFAWIQTRAGVWLERRPSSEALWSGMWELPSAEGSGAQSQLACRLGVELARRVVRIEHMLTHRAVVATVYLAESAPPWRRGPNRRPDREPLTAPLSALARKAIAATGQARAPEERP